MLAVYLSTAIYIFFNRLHVYGPALLNILIGLLIDSRNYNPQPVIQSISIRPCHDSTGPMLLAHAYICTYII